MKRIVIVAQRYGLEVNGGAEFHARKLAEHLSEWYHDRYDVHVYTTKAVDYSTWANVYTTDTEVLNGVTVHRYPVEHTRDMDAFNEYSRQIIGKPHDVALEPKWFEMQGPYSPALISALKETYEETDCFIFFTYLYYSTVAGLPLVGDKAILIPTAHDEPPIYLHTFKKLFKEPAALFFNTPLEKAFVDKMFNTIRTLNNGGRGGTGVDVPDDFNPDTSPADFFKAHPELTPTRYLFDVGRISHEKGSDTLLQYFTEYKKRHPQSDLKLVFAGKEADVTLPTDRDDIISLGFVSDEEKFSAISGSLALVNPSPFESLSIVVLEAFSQHVPVIVNGNCPVLKEHCVKGNCGLYYKDYFEFEASVNYLLTHEDVRTALGEKGYEYVEKNYNWRIIIDELSKMIDRVIDPAEAKVISHCC